MSARWWAGQHIVCHSQDRRRTRLHASWEAQTGGLARLFHPLLTIRTKATFFSHTNAPYGNQTFGRVPPHGSLSYQYGVSLRWPNVTRSVTASCLLAPP